LIFKFYILINCIFIPLLDMLTDFSKSQTRIASRIAVQHC